MFGRKTIHEEYAKAVKEIDEGQRREPKHNVPAVAKSKWSTVDPVDQFAFEEFAWLGATLDWATDDAWSFEETSDTMRRAWYLDSPEYGRRWTVYYNGLRLGWTEVSASPKKLLGTVEEYRADPQAQVDMELSMMRFVPTEAAFGILYQTAFFTQSIRGGYDAARERARLTAESAMARYMWDVMRAGEEYVPDLQFSAEGPFAMFRETVADWKESGFSPFERRRQRA
jgi:hypothetical protein